MSRTPNVQAGNCDWKAEKTYDPIKSCLWGKKPLVSLIYLFFSSCCKVQYRRRDCDYHIKGYAKLPSLYNAGENLILALPLSWPFATVSFVYVLQIPNALTTIVMAHVGAQVCLKINKQSWNSPEPPLISTSGFYPAWWRRLEEWGVGGLIETRSCAGKMCLMSLGNTLWSWKSNKISAFLGEIRKPWLSTLRFCQFYLGMCFWKGKWFFFFFFNGWQEKDTI